MILQPEKTSQQSFQPCIRQMPPDFWEELNLFISFWSVIFKLEFPTACSLRAICLGREAKGCVTKASAELPATGALWLRALWSVFWNVPSVPAGQISGHSQAPLVGALHY